VEHIFMGQNLLVILLLSLKEDIEIKEFEWYLRDHLFRQSNQGRQQQFKKESLAQEMTSLYLRYRNSTSSQHMNEMVNAVVENLISRQVLKKFENSLELTSRLSRLQCSKCFYVFYLSSNNEPRNCLRCLSNELHDFPKKK
jgi:predicted Zn-ribbon and HTH transcriptional regulator